VAFFVPGIHWENTGENIGKNSMAVQLEFINFIVPIARIEERYPGGWAQCLADHASLIGARVWYDDHLLRDGAMSPAGIGHLLEEWSELGFHTHDGGDSPTRWVDVCVAEAWIGGPTLPCDWIEVEGGSAFLKGTSKGRVHGREQRR